MKNRSIADRIIKNNFLPFILILLGFVLYYNSLSNAFSFDDGYLIVENQYLKNFKESFLSIFSNTDYYKISLEYSYRPISTLSYLICFQIWKLNPFGFHLLSLILHIINVVLVYKMLNILFKKKIISFVISLLYLTHPILTEAVNCITFNEDLLLTTFFITSIVFYLRRKESKKKANLYYIFSLIFFFLALLSKEMALILLGIIILIDIYDDETTIQKNVKKDISGFNSILNKAITKIKNNKYIYLGYIIVSAVYLYLLFIVFKCPDRPETTSSAKLFTRLIYLPVDIIIYLKLLILPISLNACREFVYPNNFFSLTNISSYLILTGLILFCFFIYKYSKKIFLGILWILLTILPVLNIYELYVPIAERYLYLPAIGFCIIIGAFLTEIIDKIKIENNLKNIIKIFLLIAILTFYSYNTIMRNPLWKDNISIKTDSLKKTPASGKSYDQLGLAYAKIGSFDEAERIFKKGIEVIPKYKFLHYDLGGIYLNKGLYDEAIFEFNKVIELDPKIYDSNYYLGLAYLKKNQIDEAIYYFKKLLEIKTDNPEYYEILAQIYISQNKYQDAVSFLEKAIELLPDNPGLRQSLASCYYDINEFDKALKEYLTVIKITPDNSEAYLAAAGIFGKFGNFGKAEEYLFKSLKYNPNNPAAYFNLGILYANQGNYSKAIKQWEYELIINPNDNLAKEYINKAKQYIK